HKIKIVLFLYAARVAGLSLNSLKTVFAISIKKSPDKSQGKRLYKEHRITCDGVAVPGASR
ncbi:hypothetical protein DSS19_25395, partial [Salmonella enterica subsp. enterica serovar Abony]|nr:hypothetical protein [Salmonella enterica subsp. enterica serovar Abony]